tara:strand:+ start:881 stop:2218 length:1338 start_codon:yes stop_codon:yes gene_type:complete
LEEYHDKRNTLMVLTAREIIQDSLTHFKEEQAKARREEVRKFLDYYSGSLTDQYIEGYFKSDAFQEIPHYNTNIVKKFVNRMSKIYTIGAKRNVSDRYSDLTIVKNARMKQMERMTRLLGTCATYVMYDEMEERFEYRPIYYFEPYFGDNPYKPESIVYPMMQGHADISDTEELMYAYWDKEIHIKFNENGDILEEIQHNLGVLPFVFTHREEQLDSFFVEGASDLISANEHINITMTEMQLGLRFQMFGQPVVTGLISDNSNVRAGSDEILTLPEGSSYNIVSPEGNVEAVIENIKWQIELVALNNHLFVTFAQSGGEVPSGISLMIKDLERHEDFIDDKELYRQYEKEFYKVEYALSQNNNLGLPEVSQFKVDFSEVEYPMTTQDKIMLNEYKLKHNLTTQAQLLADENKDLTISDAQQIIEENKSINQVEIVEDEADTEDQN